ncbi:hypothetical protein LDENG_00220040 [Lucifuga dentata]|nr:hypothetical protein LDENG_00220040 [Lucifuga dentata]
MDIFIWFSSFLLFYLPCLIIIIVFLSVAPISLEPGMYEIEIRQVYCSGPKDVQYCM